MKKPKWTCEELGVCQSLPNRAQCRTAYPFAPGVIERLPRRRWLTDQRVEQLARAALVLALMATLAATLYLATNLQLLEGVL